MLSNEQFAEEAKQAVLRFGPPPQRLNEPGRSPELWESDAQNMLLWCCDIACKLPEFKWIYGNYWPEPEERQKELAARCGEILRAIVAIALIVDEPAFFRIVDCPPNPGERPTLEKAIDDALRLIEQSKNVLEEGPSRKPIPRIYESNLGGVYQYITTIVDREDALKAMVG